MRALKATHVLDAAQNGDIALTPEIKELPAVEVGYVLGPDNDHTAVEGYHTKQLLLKIRGPRRQVDQ